MRYIRNGRKRMKIDTDELKHSGDDIDDKYLREYYDGTAPDGSKVILILIKPRQKDTP